MELIFIVGAFVVGVGCGLAGYREWLKRDPAALELWAKKIKEAGERV